MAVFIFTLFTLLVLCSIVVFVMLASGRWHLDLTEKKMPDDPTHMDIIRAEIRGAINDYFLTEGGIFPENREPSLAQRAIKNFQAQEERKKQEKERCELIEEARDDLELLGRFCEKIINDPRRDWLETANAGYTLFRSVMLKHYSFYKLYVKEGHTAYSVDPKQIVPVWTFLDDEDYHRPMEPTHEKRDPSNFTVEIIEKCFADPWYNQQDQFAFSQWRMIISLNKVIGDYLSDISK
jgi:hypothetical protein